MRITLFTSNQPRHINLANKLGLIADEVFCIQECNTVFPGQVEDFYKKSDVMQKYFQGVIEAEKKLFGGISFSGSNVRMLSVKSGDINNLNKQVLAEAMKSDIFIVFGASFIKGWLADFLLSKGALNIHIGISPYYRGTACNFWALYDENPSYVGATIHLLSKGIDNGDMLFHCIPLPKDDDDTFLFTMRSVEVAHEALVSHIENGKIYQMKSYKQDKGKEIRYSRNTDFNDAVAGDFLKRNISLSGLEYEYPALTEPFFG